MNIALTRRPAVRILKASAAALLVLISPADAGAQGTLYTYTFDTVSTSSGTTTPGAVANNITFGSFTAVGTPANPNATGRFSFIGWSLGATSGQDTFTGGIDLSEYYEVTLAPDAGFSLDLDNISFTLQRSGTGIRQYSVRSSLDDYASNLAASISPANANLSVVHTPDANIFQVSDGTSAYNGSLVTLGNPFDALTSAVTFRFYGWNAEGSTGTFSIDNVSFIGLVGSGALPLYWDTNNTTLGTGGSGIWDGANSNWSESEAGDGPMTQFAPASLAIFGGTAGTVTIDTGGVTPQAGLRFETAGYTIGGERLILNAVASIETAHAEGTITTIESEIAGSSGLTKTGAGTLVLAASNSFDGVVTLSGGAVEISQADNLGVDGNDLSFGGGKLLVTETMAFAATRDLSGAGSIEVQAGKTLSVAGPANLSSLTLSGPGTLAVNGTARSVGAVTFTEGGTLSSAAGEITATSLTTTHAIGTATVTPDLNLGAALREVTVANGTAEIDLALEGAITLTGGSGSRLHKLGLGTLLLSGDNTTLSGSVRIGTAGQTPAPGGTVVIDNKNALGTGAGLQIQFNDGVLRSTTELTGANAIPLGLSVGAGQGVPATFTGENMEFTGNVNFFRAGGDYTHAIRVENTTTFSGSFNVSQSGGTSSGFNLTGDGKLVLAGASNTVAEPIVVNGPALAINGALSATAATVLVEEGTLMGSGSIAGNTTLEDGAFLAPGDGPGTLTFGGNLDIAGAIASSTGALKFELDTIAGSDRAALTAGALTIGSGLLDFSDFDFTTTAGFGGGIYTLFETSTAIAGTFGPTAGVVGGFAGTIELSGDGTDIVLNVVPEPGSAMLLLGGLGLMAARRRRR